MRPPSRHDKRRMRKAAKAKAAAAASETVHYPFDFAWLRMYKTLLEMLLERGYNIVDEPGIVNGQVKVDGTTIPLLEKKYGGAEKFQMGARHSREPGLNISIYYLIPEAEAGSTAQKRKQISDDQLSKVLNAFEESDTYQRLLLISHTGLAPLATGHLKQANLQKKEGQPYRLLIHLPAEFFAFNIMRSRFQPKSITIYRTPEDKANFLQYYSTLRDSIEDKQETLAHLKVNDPLAFFLGLKEGDVISFLRQYPRPTFYVRQVVSDFSVL